MDETPYPRLFSPQILAGQRLKNRITHASISPRFGAQQGLHPRYLHYYVNRAKGGAAMANAMPVLPEVASIKVSPGRMSPRSCAR